MKKSEENYISIINKIVPKYEIIDSLPLPTHGSVTNISELHDIRKDFAGTVHSTAKEAVIYQVKLAYKENATIQEMRNYFNIR